MRVVIDLSKWEVPRVSIEAGNESHGLDVWIELALSGHGLGTKPISLRKQGTFHQFRGMASDGRLVLRFGADDDKASNIWIDEARTEVDRDHGRRTVFVQCESASVSGFRAKVDISG